jgi:hypothetical protein
MWRRRMIQRARLLTRLIVTSHNSSNTRKSRSNRSMSLKGEKSLVVVPWGRQVLLDHERRPLQIKGNSDNAIIFFGVTRSGVFGRGTQYNLYKNTRKFWCVYRVRAAWIPSTYSLSRNRVRLPTQGRTLTQFGTSLEWQARGAQHQCQRLGRGAACLLRAKPQKVSHVLPRDFSATNPPPNNMSART